MKIYSKWDIEAEVLNLKALLVNKGMYDPEVTFEMSTKDWKPCRLALTYKLRADSTGNYESFYGESMIEVEAILDKGREFIGNLKSREELEHDEFMQMLGRVMDRAKDLGLDEDFVNPLTSMMKKLATNAIEHKR